MEPEQFLSKPENITFCLNTDGVAVFKSSTAQIWPIWLQINELPPKMRYSDYYYFYWLIIKCYMQVLQEIFDTSRYMVF